jgi:hypothetical protein
VVLRNAASGWRQFVRVLGINPAFNCMPPQRRDIALPQSQLFSRSNPDLRLYQINAADGLCNRMLHLEASIHFNGNRIRCAQTGTRTYRRHTIADALARIGAPGTYPVRSLEGMPNAGASSRIFWWRRCMDHSFAYKDSIAMFIG